MSKALVYRVTKCEDSDSEVKMKIKKKHYLTYLHLVKFQETQLTN
jgi:hypothetical protein